MIRQRCVGQPAMREGQPTERESPLQSQKLEGGVADRQRERREDQVQRHLGQTGRLRPGAIQGRPLNAAASAGGAFPMCLSWRVREPSERL